MTVTEAMGHVGLVDTSGVALKITKDAINNGRLEPSRAASLVPADMLRASNVQAKELEVAFGAAGGIVVSPTQDARALTLRPTRILILASNPDSTTRLRLDREERLIRTELELAPVSRAFDLHTRPATTNSDIARYLIEIRPNILHVSGHGGVSGIVVENEDGRPHVIPPRALRELFQIHQVSESIRLVVLNSCYSHTTARALAGPADCVVGMRAGIADESAITFARSFYMALGHGLSIGEALAMARASISIAGLPGSRLPVLFERNKGDAAGLRMFRQ